MRALASLISCFALLVLAPALCSAATMYTVTDLGTLGGNLSVGFGINASGEVTGRSLLADNSTFHAFVYDGTMHDLGSLGIGTYSSGSAINASGVVVGSFRTDASGDVHAFRYDGTMHDLGTFGGANSQAAGINDSGQVVGYAETTDTTTSLVLHAFLYDGTMHDIGTLGGSFSEADAINAGGKVVGYSNILGSPAQHAFIYDGTMHDIGTLGGANSYPSSINASGEVTGESEPTGSSVYHAFLYDGTTMHDLGTLPGYAYSGAAQINDLDQVVGTATATNNAETPFIYDAAHGMVDLNALISPSSGWTLTAAGGINDLGQIAGYGTIGGVTHTFLLTPVPEPSTLVLAALGMIGLLGYVRRGRLGALA